MEKVANTLAAGNTVIGLLWQLCLVESAYLSVSELWELSRYSFAWRFTMGKDAVGFGAKHFFERNY
jgi:hypothetical protein